jgi:transmembrane sensor
MDKQLFDKIQKIKKKFLSGIATKEEVELLHSYYDLFEGSIGGVEGLSDGELEDLKTGMKLTIYKKLHNSRKNPGKIRRLIYWSAAASLLCFVLINALFIHSKRPIERNDLNPAENLAFLTLGNGQKIVLSSIGSGNLAKQQNVQIIRQKNGVISYDVLNKESESIQPVYNTLTNPRGSQVIALELPDHTHVWLNAESTISYPVTFSANERKVTMTGEACFEVAHNAKNPFSVEVRGQTIKDIGTQFNINAYENEPVIKTSLKEGAISITNSSCMILLKPGQQAIVSRDSQGILVKPADLNEVYAWKEGYFYFNQADIRTVMRQLARWYNVDVGYEGELPLINFKGKIHRNINASQALSILSYFGVQYKIEGKKIIISK